MNNTNNESILVVDDDRDIVNTLKIQLEKENYTVHCAYNGNEALDTLAAEKIHLILLDIMMPQLDGFSAIMKIRERQNIPIIVMSAKSDKILGLSIVQSFTEACAAAFTLPRTQTCLPHVSASRWPRHRKRTITYENEQQ